MRFRLRTPRPEHQEADPVEQEVWKKKLVSVVKQVQSAHPDADVEVWTMDEHRLGLSASAAGCLGSPRRTTDCQCVFWRFQWLWLYGFVHPKSGETKRVDSA